MDGIARSRAKRIRAREDFREQIDRSRPARPDHGERTARERRCEGDDRRFVHHRLTVVGVIDVGLIDILLSVALSRFHGKTVSNFAAGDNCRELEGVGARAGR